MKIYTRQGDDGLTGLYGGGRVRKDAPRIEAYGTVDELNALVGLARGEELPTDVDEVLARVQHLLFDLGAELATPEPEARGTDGIDASHAAWLESTIDRFESGLEPLKNFILPGGCRAASTLHVARVVCRRAERRVVTMSESDPVRPELLVLLNRLGDLLFVLAREANRAAGRADVPWQKLP